MSVDLRQADEGDITALYDFYRTIGQIDEGYFEAIFEKDCIILVAEKQDLIIAFGILNFEPKYALYKKLEIPEIQDLNVAPDHRQQGVATMMIKSFENLARDQGSKHIGISVGLTKDYGPAQRLYCKLGYFPDGNGVTADRESVSRDQMVRINDDLCLMLLKEF